MGRTGVLGALLLLLGGCSSVDVNFRNIEWPDAGYPARTVTASLVRPDGEGPYPAVVLLHTCGGVQSHVRTEWPEYLASLGYVSLTVDTFGSRGLGPCPNGLHPADRLPKTDAYREMTRDAFGALDYLATLPFVKGDRVAVMGFSLGANTINTFLAHQPPRGLDFVAAVGLYGSCDELLRRTRPRAALMQLAGERDLANRSACEGARSVVSEVHVLPGARHAWDVRGDSYSAEATARSRELVRAFLARHLR